ncbi:hypothetical protein B484DRAFT_342033 [Ochromonadaceae sp. CCMP2298]|nr:hypothetical protein B484DRAFT_342033 [Ochromonadaceae sp. CCMP2298]
MGGIVQECVGYIVIFVHMWRVILLYIHLEGYVDTNVLVYIWKVISADACEGNICMYYTYVYIYVLFICMYVNMYVLYMYLRFYCDICMYLEGFIVIYVCIWRVILLY